MIYMTSSFLIFGIRISPLSLLSDTWDSVLEIIYSIAICSISMYKAFSLPTMKKRIGYFVLYLTVSVLIYMLIILGIVALIGFEKT